MQMSTAILSDNHALFFDSNLPIPLDTVKRILTFAWISLLKDNTVHILIGFRTGHNCNHWTVVVEHVRLTVKSFPPIGSFSLTILSTPIPVVMWTEIYRLTHGFEDRGLKFVNVDMVGEGTGLLPLIGSPNAAWGHGVENKLCCFRGSRTIYSKFKFTESVCANVQVDDDHLGLLILMTLLFALFYIVAVLFSQFVDSTFDCKIEGFLFRLSIPEQRNVTNVYDY
eukprot:Nk52_evm1s1652 gene=Nk52_evmTU1s1652